MNKSLLNVHSDKICTDFCRNWKPDNWIHEHSWFLETKSTQIANIIRTFHPYFYPWRIQFYHLIWKRMKKLYLVLDMLCHTKISNRCFFPIDSTVKSAYYNPKSTNHLIWAYSPYYKLFILINIRLFSIVTVLHIYLDYFWLNQTVKIHSLFSPLTDSKQSDDLGYSPYL